MNRVIDETEFIVREEAAEKRFTFRKVDFNRDFEMLYEWMHYPHIAPFWSKPVDSDV